MGPLRTCHRPAAIVIAASSILQHSLFGLLLRCFVTMMRALAETTGMRRRGFRLHRHRNNRSEKGDQQQKSGSNPLHAVRWIRTPSWVENKAEFRAKQVSSANRQKFYKATKSESTVSLQKESAHPDSLRWRMATGPEI